MLISHFAPLEVIELWQQFPEGSCFRSFSLGELSELYFISN